MATCYRCQSDNPDTATYCASCGTSLTSPPPAAVPPPPFGAVPSPPAGMAGPHYSPNQHPTYGAVPPPALQPAPGRFTGLSTALTVLFSIVALLSVLGAVLLSGAARKVANIANSDASTFRQIVMADDAAGMAAVGSILFALLALPIFVLLVIFAQRARRNLDLYGVRGARLSAGMAVGSWFIPLFWYLGPYWSLSDSYRGTAPGAAQDPNWRKGPRNTLLLAWWVLWSIANAIFWVAYVMSGSTSGSGSNSSFDIIDNTDRTVMAFNLQAVAFVLCVPSAVLATLGLRQLAQRQDRVLEGGPPPMDAPVNPIS